jgi:hypothetical protein
LQAEGGTDNRALPKLSSCEELQGVFLPRGLNTYAVIGRNTRRARPGRESSQAWNAAGNGKNQGKKHAQTFRLPARLDFSGKNQGFLANLAKSVDFLGIMPLTIASRLSTLRCYREYLLRPNSVL